MNQIFQIGAVVQREKTPCQSSCAKHLETEDQPGLVVPLNTSPRPCARMGTGPFWIVSTLVNSRCGDFPAEEPALPGVTLPLSTGKVHSLRWNYRSPSEWRSRCTSRMRLQAACNSQPRKWLQPEPEKTSGPIQTGARVGIRVVITRKWVRPQPMKWGAVSQRKCPQVGFLNLCRSSLLWPAMLCLEWLRGSLEGCQGSGETPVGKRDDTNAARTNLIGNPLVGRVAASYLAVISHWESERA